MSADKANEEPLGANAIRKSGVDIHRRDLIAAAGSTVALGVGAAISSNAARAQQMTDNPAARSPREVRIRMDDGGLRTLQAAGLTMKKGIYY